MPRVSPIQESFAYGEIDNRVQSRVSTDAYKGGLKRCRNWYPLVQGPVRTREGSKFRVMSDGRNWTSGNTATSGFRVFTFQRGLDIDAIFEVGERFIPSNSKFLIGRDSVTGAQLVDGESTNLVVDSQYTQPIPGVYWQTNTTAFDFGGGSTPVWAGPFNAGTENAYMKVTSVLDNVGQDFLGGALDRTSGSGAIIIPAGSELLVNTVTLSLSISGGFGGFGILAALAAAFGATTAWPLKYRLQIGTTPGASDVHDATIDITGTSRQTYVETFTPGASNNTLYMRIGWAWTGGVIPACIPIKGFCSQSIDMLIYPASWIAPLAGGSGSDVEFVSPWTADQLECLQWAQDPGEQFGIFTHPDVEPHVLKYVAPDWIFQPISSEPGYVAPTGSTWGGANGFPRAVAFHEGRSWFGGSPGFPNALWASASGDYVDLDAAAAATKADPLLFALSLAGTIQTLTSRKELVINTDISEVVGDSTEGPIAFDDFNFPKQTDWGSNCVQPMVVGRDMVYTSASRKRVRTFADEGGTRFGYDGNELSLLAHDIFGSAVRRMVYLDEPSYQAFFLLSDGTCGVATFFYPENAIGWWRMSTAWNGQGDPTNANVTQDVNNIMDITSIQTSAGQQLWMVVNRSGMVNGLQLSHEVVGFETGLRARLENCVAREPYDVFADGNLRFDLADNLSDTDCNVIVEQTDPATGELYWSTHPNVEVFAGVSTPLEPWVAGGTVYAGLPLPNDIQLLSLEGVSNRGSSQPSKRRWNKVFARLNDSPVPLIEGVYAKDRTPATPMGLGEPFITGDTEIVDLGSGEGDLVITQDKNLMTEITGIFGKVQSSQI